MNTRNVLLALVALVLLLPAAAQAQIEANLSKYTGPNAEGYLNPIKEGFGAALQAGMFRSAYIPKDELKINLSVHTAFVKFSDDDRTFRARLEEGFYPVHPEVAGVEAPTVIGSTEAVVIEGAGGTAAVFPGGLDVGSTGLAEPQLTISGFLGTQLALRYIAAETGDADLGDVQLLGAGLRHSISQYFPTSPVDIAAGFMWQNLQVGDDLIDATALSFGLQGSKRYGVLEPYIGLAIDTFSMSVEYEYGDEDPPDMLKVDFESSTDFHPSAGLGINLGPVHIFGEIGTASQTTYAVGLALGN